MDQNKPRKKGRQNGAQNVEFGMEFGDINAGKFYELPFMNRDKDQKKNKNEC
ncbi:MULTISPECIES: hypothetical protein [unclassified Cytobacillus]|mgnify:CR=1 FL=1|uniref:hypothetical protein n=1 Tax=unclassified Cytobacillus TaxID=2675268 RepID=UPI0013FA7423|nr:hypothetical protein [Cytobacillus sp. AMY 15.2]KAF0816172.1 hypothetical protein KIS4809_5044 [Bacillus sp. ZZV12-4809]MCM3090280.1 hypothetical protein [Cytobacillus sp. AMY 15.2]